MSRKGENIFLRKDGRWEARYIIGHDEYGKTRYGYTYGKTYLEAKRNKNSKIIELQELIENNKKFGVVVDTFLKIKKLKVKESTYCRYTEIIKIYLLPVFSNCNIYDIDDEFIINFYSDNLEDLSPKTQKDVLILLNQILKYSGSNIRAVYPKVEKKPIVILNEKEIVKLEHYIFDNFNNITLSFIVALYCGLRIGEMCALKWSDIDLVNKYIKVSKTLTRIKNLDANDINKTKIVITSPKSNNSNRYIPIPNFLSELFYKLKPEYSNDVYFLSGTNLYIEPRLLRYKFKKIEKELELEYTFHMLRHTFATRCTELGFDPKTLSELLGHANVKTTMSLYVHPRNEYKVKCMERLELLSSQSNI